MFRRLIGKVSGKATLCLALALATYSSSSAQSPTQPPASENITFHEMTFHLAGSGWTRHETATQINLARSNRPGHSQSLSIWPVRFPGSIRELSQQQHAAGYFDFERHQTRPPGSRWEGFSEATRTVGAAQYPVMSFAVQMADAKADGLFLLYFPPDFQEVQRFYCFMYQELYPADAGQQGVDLQTLDAVLSTFRVAPATPSSPPIPPGRQNPVRKRGGEDLVIDKRQPEVDALQQLSVDRAERQMDTIPNAKVIAAKYAHNVDNARTYGSVATLIDRGSPELAANGYARSIWQLDVVDPDRSHVAQHMWNGHAYDYDEWISIKNLEFNFVGLWMQFPKPTRMELGQKLSVKRYVPILRDDSPNSAVNFSYGERRYVLLTYLRPIHGDAWPSVVEGSSVQLDVWIDSATGLLAKTRAVAASALPGGVPLEFEQIFVAWSEDIRVEAPVGALKMNKKMNK